MRFVLVGTGFRSVALGAVADGLGLARVATLGRTPDGGHGDLAACLGDARPDFVLAAVQPTSAAGVVATCVQAGVPVLTETPPGPDEAAMDDLWDEVGSSGLVQVAEQYPRMPLHAARIAVARSGLLGGVSQVQVSSTQTYHAIALMRAFLGIEDDASPVRVRASSTTAPLASPLSRQGWTDDEAPSPATTTIATLDFGGGRSGLYDFTDNQTRNPLRTRRLVVRGSLGELDDDRIVRLAGPRRVVTRTIQRWQTGHDLDLFGYHTEAITLDDTDLWRNRWPGQRWNDDELAVADLLAAMAAWVRGEGPQPYPLARAIGNHRIGLAVDRAVATDATVEVHPGANGAQIPEAR